MNRRARLQIPLMICLVMFTFVNLVPILWGLVI